MHREGDLIFLDKDEQYDLQQPSSIIHASKAPKLYGDLTVRIFHAAGVQQILALHEAREMEQDERDARSGCIDQRIEELEKVRGHLGVLAAKEIAEDGIDQVMSQLGLAA